MAMIGLRYFVFAPVTDENDGGLPTYGAGVRVDDAISADVTFSRNSNNTLYGDDKPAEVDNSITGVSITIGANDLTDEMRAAMLGDREDEDDEGTIIENTSGGPYGGFGYVRVRKLHGVVRFIGYWVYKISFANGDESMRTKGENVEWQTPTVQGTGMGVDRGGEMPEFRERSKPLDNYAAAMAWVNAHMSAAPGA